MMSPQNRKYITYRNDAEGRPSHAIGNMHKTLGKDRACGSGDIFADRQTHADILITSQYFRGLSNIYLSIYRNTPTTATTMQVASEGEAIASDGSVFDVVHEFQRLHSTTWKLMAVEFGDSATLNVDLVCIYART